MKFVKRLALAAVVLATVVVGAVPAPASTAAVTVTLSGTINLSSGTTTRSLAIGASCASAGASVDPTVGAENCALSASGSASGDCLLWSGVASGSIRWSTLSVGTMPDHSVTLVLTVRAGAILFDGFANGSDGRLRAVKGAGELHQNWSNGTCSPGTPASFVFNGTLTIAG